MQGSFWLSGPFQQLLNSDFLSGPVFIKIKWYFESHSKC